MSELSVEVLKITKHPNEAAIKVRWRIKGIPLIRKAVPYIGRRIKVDADGYRSVFFLFMWLNVIYAKFELSQCWPVVCQGDHALWGLIWGFAEPMCFALQLCSLS